VNYQPPPPAGLFDRETRPSLELANPDDPGSGEAVYENWISNIDDWGKGLDAQVYRGCKWANTLLSMPVACGAAPAGIEP
jgi:hypothetical protein